MKIFYIDIYKFKQKFDKSFLGKFADIELKTEKRFYEYTIGRYLVKTAVQNFYGIDNAEIIISKKGKPIFKNADIHFSISHSNNYIAVCVDKYNCGLDIEYIKQRNLERISKYYKKEFKTLDDFYKFWTLKEAEYKLDSTVNESYSCLFKDEYYLTIASETKIKDVDFIDLTFQSDRYTPINFNVI